MRSAALQFDTRSAFETDEGCRVEPWDGELDVEAALARLSRKPLCLFLDSARRDPVLGRYSFLTADPFETIAIPVGGVESLAEVERRMAGWRTTTLAELPPFQGGAAGLFSYDMGRWLEKVPEPRIGEFKTPALALGLYDTVLAIDHLERRAWIISQGFPELDRKSRSRRAGERVEQFRAWLTDPPSGRSRCEADSISELSIDQLAPRFAVTGPAGLMSNMSAEHYLQAIRRAIEYIHAGDVFQVNIAQRLLFAARDDSVSLYLRLRNRNPATFAGYFDLGDAQIVSASPERFLKVSGHDVEARPIKGTRQRTARPEADLFAGDEMLQSEKDRAENVMIVDLLRNDLARVCEPDSVRVTQLCRLETYQFVQHLVSAVRGTLAAGKGPLDLLRASFPGGSITGAPKVRAMEIIAELEPTARGAYCGALGYLGFDGAMDTNILIRTITASRGWWQAPVGGGIVAQSDPAREYEETWHKATGLIRALEQRIAMILLIDNYDSFVFNLARYFERLGQPTRVMRNDTIDVTEIESLEPAGIVLSPGPCTPNEAGVSLAVVRQLATRVPLLGICLGHQVIGSAFGGRVVRAAEPVHGRTSSIFHDGQSVFAGLANPLVGCRYHSLIVDRATLPECLEITAWTSDGTIMALAHRELPIVGLQFHPESILTDLGYDLLAGFLRLAGIAVPASVPRIASERDETTSPGAPLPNLPVTF